MIESLGTTLAPLIVLDPVDRACNEPSLPTLDTPPAPPPNKGELRPDCRECFDPAVDTFELYDD